MAKTLPSPSCAPPAANPPPAWRGLLLRLLVAAVVVGGLALIEPSLVVDTVRSPQALVVVAAIVAAFWTLSWGLGRLVANGVVRTVLLAVPLLAVAWVLVVPYLRDVRVDEGLPGAAAAGDQAAPGEQAAPGDQAAPAAQPVVLAGGPLVGIDHRADGAAALYRLDDGSLLVRLEEIAVDNGPDFRVYLVPVPAAEAPQAGAVDLGALKGNTGSHNYPVPAGADVGGELTVLIWCRAFAVPIAHAALTAA